MRYTLYRGYMIRPILAPFGAVGSTSFAEITEDRLHVKLGALCDDSFAISDMASVEHSTWPLFYGLGVRLGWGRKLGVVISTKNVVAIHFNKILKIPIIFSLTKEVEHLYLSVETPDRFIEELRQRMGARG